MPRTPYSSKPSRRLPTKNARPRRSSSQPTSLCPPVISSTSAEHDSSWSSSFAMPSSSPGSHTVRRKNNEALSFAFNASLTSVNLAKAFARQQGMNLSVGSTKTLLHNAAMVDRFIAMSGKSPNRRVILTLLSSCSDGAFTSFCH